MSGRQETADAIIDEMRDCARAADPSIWGGAAIQKLVENTKRQQLAYCDRLEAALERERSQVGNKAAWRAALMEIRSDAMSDYEQDADYLIDKCNAALSAPPRNCDVGTAEEQGERCLAQFNEWRRKSDGKKLITAIMAWAQTPYAAEGAGK